MPVRRGGLGRGLDSLLQASTPASDAAGTDEAPVEAHPRLRELPIDEVHPNPAQPRRRHDTGSLEGLAASIRAVGVLQPVLVRDRRDGGFELIAGERRWRASRLAGRASLPAIVLPVGAEATLERALVENIQREDLSPLEEAAAYRQLLDDLGLTHETLARRLGKSRTTITNTLRLLQLAPPVQELVLEGRLSAGHARALLPLEEPDEQHVLAVRVAEEGLSTRAVEDLVRKHARGEVPRPRALRMGSARPPAVLEVEERLAAVLETDVTVRLRRSGGQIVLGFSSLEDLDRVFRRMVSATDESGPTGRAEAAAP